DLRIGDAGEHDRDAREGAGAAPARAPGRLPADHRPPAGEEARRSVPERARAFHEHRYMNPGEQQYLDLLEELLERGARKSDRTGTGTLSVFGRQMRFSLRDSFPLLTTKKLHLKSIVYELLWFLRGETNIKYLKDHGVTIWNEWADAKGNLGRVYGAQWCDWRTADGRSINQIDQVIAQIKKDPESRRHIVSAWNVGELEQMALPPCHALFQFFVNDNELSCQLYQ